MIFLLFLKKIILFSNNVLHLPKPYFFLISAVFIICVLFFLKFLEILFLFIIKKINLVSTHRGTMLLQKFGLGGAIFFWNETMSASEIKKNFLAGIFLLFFITFFRLGELFSIFEGMDCLCFLIFIISFLGIRAVISDAKNTIIIIAFFLRGPTILLFLAWCSTSFLVLSPLVPFNQFLWLLFKAFHCENRYIKMSSHYTCGLIVLWWKHYIVFRFVPVFIPA